MSKFYFRTDFQKLMTNTASADSIDFQLSLGCNSEKYFKVWNSKLKNNLGNYCFALIFLSMATRTLPVNLMVAIELRFVCLFRI